MARLCHFARRNNRPVRGGHLVDGGGSSDDPRMAPAPIDREDVRAIMISLMELHAKVDRLRMLLGDEDDEEDPEEDT